MNESNRDFFISYHQADAQWAIWIAAELEQAGYTCFIQAWDFLIGGNFVVDMHKALMQSERFIAVLSQDYFNSLYCQLEWAAALEKDLNSINRSFIPIRVSDVKPKGIFARIVYIDLFDVDEKIAKNRLLAGVDVAHASRIIPKLPSSPLPHIVKRHFPTNLPINNLPIMRNAYFTDRERVLEAIYNGLESGNTISLTQTIKGMGGLGKTQAALEYAYRYAYKYSCIWWVLAETEATVLVAYKSFTIEMGLLKKEQQDNELIIQAVLNWMDSNDNWLFIYDNVSDISEDTTWLPKKNRENVIITTRNNHILIGEKVDISVFTKEEAIDFLDKRTNINDDRQGASNLADRLGYIPLALEQAAAYIKINHITYFEYVSLLEQYGLEVLEEVTDVINYRLPIAKTLKISIDHIEHEAARQLLYLCSYMSADNIDETIFSDNEKLLPSPLGEVMANKLKRNEIWKELILKSLLTKEAGEGYSMHRLIQETVRNMIEHESQWMELCLSIFYEVYKFEFGDVSNQNRFVKLTPHVEAFLSFIKSISYMDDEIYKKIAYLYSEGGYGYYCLGNYFHALEWFKNALAIHEDILGESHPDTAATYNNIASVHRNMGNYTKSLEWYHKTLAIREKTMGTDHPDTATAYNNIANVYSHQGDYQKSLEWYHKALVVREKALDISHPDSATTYNNIASVYYNQGDYSKSLEWYHKALSIYEKVLGKDHPSTATIYNNIAGVYNSQGNYDVAMEWYQKALAISEKVLGTDHPSTAVTYNNVANVYASQEEYDKALEWFHKALSISEKVLGEAHPDIFVTYNNIALVYSRQGDYFKALEWYYKSLSIGEKVLGVEHPSVAKAYNNIAFVYSKQGDYPQALEWYNKALAVFEKTLGPEHPSNATIYNNIANIYKIQGNHTEALELQKSAQSIYEKTSISLDNFSIKEDMYLDNILYPENQIAYDDRVDTEIQNLYTHYKNACNSIERYNPEEFAKFLYAFNNIVNKIKSQMLFEYKAMKKDICHYTKIDALKHLIKYNEVKPKLRLSNVAYMNDPSEGKIFVDVLDGLSENKFFKKLFGFGQRSDNKLEEFNLSNVFIGSFSTAINKLPMWTLYGDDSKGCCLVFEDNYFDDLPYKVDNSKSSETTITLYKVHYIDVDAPEASELYSDLKKLVNILDAQTDAILSDDRIKKWIIEGLESIRFLFKCKDYEYEDEVRVVIYPEQYEITVEDNFLIVPKLFVYIDRPLSYKEVILGSKIEKPSEIIPFLLHSDSVKRVSSSGIEYH